jgi:riboflavin synthase alpha subunit
MIEVERLEKNYGSRARLEGHLVLGEVRAK